MIVAAWTRYVSGVDEAGRTIDVRDPLAERLARLAAEAGPFPERLARTLLDVRSIFGNLGGDERVGSAVRLALERLYAHGAARACENSL